MIDKLDRQILLAHAMGCERADIAAGRKPTPEQEREFEAMAARREAGEPIAYITGHKEFYGLNFRTSRDTLIPRPDSETMIDAAIESSAGAAPGTILDLGTGSGCLIITLLRLFPSARGTGIDISAGAIRTARENAEALNVADRIELVCGDWSKTALPRADITISNPPYVREGDKLMRDVSEYEPAAALYAGADGMDAYRSIAALGITTGKLFLEIGAGQEADAARIFAPGRFVTKSYKDLAGITRVLEFAVA
jgi:release factor glutamine methyltransferase